MKTKLTIVIPSYFHFYLIEDIFKHCVKSNIESSINFLILNCDSDENFEKLNKLIENKENWEIVKCDKSLAMEQKLFNNVHRIQTPYAYVCGDGLLPNLEKITELINDNENKDLLILVKTNSIFHENFLKMSKIKNEKEKLAKLFYFLTFCGGSIVKTELLQDSLVNEIDFNSNFLYPITVLNNLHRHFNDNYIFAIGDYYDFSPLKKESTRFDKESIVYVWTLNYVKSVFLLNKEYDDLRPYILNSKYDNKFSFKFLLIYKYKGVFDYKIYKKYSYYYKICGNSWFKLYLVKLIPSFALTATVKLVKLFKV